MILSIIVPVYNEEKTIIETLKKIKSNSSKILCKVIKRGKKFYEVLISYNGRNISEGKKIIPHHFFLILFKIIRRRII